MRRHSGFVAWPVRLVVPESDDGEMPNTPTPVWRRDRASDEDEAELYRQVGDQHWGEPLLTVPLSLEGRLEFRAVLFVPPTAPADPYAAAAQHGPRLYVRNVLLVEDCSELLPAYLRFVRGVVDAPDLPLTLSRENIQSDPRIELIRRQLTRKLLSALEDLSTADPGRYRGFWAQFGTVLKEGLIDDSANRATLLRLARFASTAGDEPTALANYTCRMPEGQGHLLYVAGASEPVLRSSPHLEAHIAAGRRCSCSTTRSTRSGWRRTRPSPTCRSDRPARRIPRPANQDRKRSIPPTPSGTARCSAGCKTRWPARSAQSGSPAR